ncbi:unnamed protein product [Brachionus calyciflorus]|uniref:Sulfide:quinone oxidoreductase, mitochondrial n=1 Tax=Brachionus calyciflorus TaxID=104777 RepID=A0A813UVP5_9BILA|nr:unnamed protein product [Brachionus calyciflorus]
MGSSSSKKKNKCCVQCVPVCQPCVPLLPQFPMFPSYPLIDPCNPCPYVPYGFGYVYIRQMEIDLETLLSQDIDLGFTLSDIYLSTDLQTQDFKDKTNDKNENNLVTNGYRIILEDETGENFTIISNDDLINEPNRTQFINDDLNNLDSLNFLDNNWVNQMLGEQQKSPIIPFDLFTFTEKQQLNQLFELDLEINLTSDKNSFSFNDDTQKNAENRDLYFKNNEKCSDSLDCDLMTQNEVNSKEISLQLNEKKPKINRKKSDDEKSEKYKLRYEQFLIENHIPLKLKQIVETTANEFNDLIQGKKLSHDQVFQVKDIRRKVKNKRAAQNCRRRRNDSIENLAEQVEELKKKRAILYTETTKLQNQVQETLEIFNNLYQNSIGNIFNSTDPKIAVFNDYHTQLNTKLVQQTDLEFLDLDLSLYGNETGDDDYEDDDDDDINLIDDSDLKFQLKNSKNNYKLVVVGGGSGGLAISSRFSRKLGKNNVALIDPSEWHLYQPGWTLAAGGLKKPDSFRRPQSKMIPSGVDWIKQKASIFHPESNTIILDNGEKVKYDYLVMATGIKIDFDGIKGLKDALVNDEQVVSMYSHETVKDVFPAIQKFKGGNAIFTFPRVPVKCPGAPQKVMYLAEEHFRKSGIRDQAQVIYCTTLPVIFGVKKYADALMQVVKERDIKLNTLHHLIEIDYKNKIAIFEKLDQPGTIVKLNYSLLHVCPPMKPFEEVKNSPLVDQAGFVDLDKYTLQHKKYSNVFGIGDCTNLPTSKTAAAIAAESSVLTTNLNNLMNGKDPSVAKYDGYSSCPLITSNRKAILAEFDYDGKPLETFPICQGKQRRSMFHLKSDLMPLLYWNLFVKGYWGGPGPYRKMFKMFFFGKD